MTDPTSTDSAPAETASTETTPAETVSVPTAPTNEAPAEPTPQADAPRKIPWGGIAAVVVFLGIVVMTMRPRHHHGGGGMLTPTGAPAPPLTNNGRLVPMTPSELALFAPLTVGSALGRATIVSLQSGNGTLTVNVTFGSTPQVFRVARANANTTAMHLRATGPFTVYQVGNGTGTDRAAIEQASQALEAVLARHSDGPVPSNLSPCCPFNGSAAAGS